MFDVLKETLHAPMGNLFVVFGLLLVAIAAIGKIVGKIEPDRTGRIASGLVGAVLIFLGLTIHSRTHDEPRAVAPGGSTAIPEEPSRPEPKPAAPAPVPEPGVSINLTELAPAARWESGQLMPDGHNVQNAQPLEWMGREDDDRGFVRFDRVALEDGQALGALRMHPQWATHGTVKGWLPWVRLPPRAVFEAQVGFVNGAAGSDGVVFMVWEHHKEGGREVWNQIASVTKGYTSRLQIIRSDLSHLAGQEVGIELRVDAGASSGQDWAAWVNPVIVQRR